MAATGSCKRQAGGKNSPKLFRASSGAWKLIFVLCLVYISLFLETSEAKKKDVIAKSSRELLEKESKKLKKKSITCSLTVLSQETLDHLRITNQIPAAVACHLKHLKEQEENDWTWSSLGTLYQLPGELQSSAAATTCFKQAAKLAGKLPRKFIKQWHFLGPFIIGKGEVDGDPIAAYGGIQNVSSSRMKKGEKFYSELAPEGVVSWSVFQQSQEGEALRIQPNIDWNDLINSLGSMGVTEWQGWVVGEFATNDQKVNILIQCLGVHTVYVNGVPVTGDIYRRDQFWFSVKLERGIHTLSVRLRTKVAQVLQCKLNVAPSPLSFEVLSPHFMPDIYDGYLFSGYFALPIINYHTSVWLKNIKVSITEQTGENLLNFLAVNLVESKSFAIGPGQVRPVHLHFFSQSPSGKVLSACSNSVNLKLKVSTSDGFVHFPIEVRCRKKEESFLFTFVDHDGSIQHAAAVHPIEECELGLCPVLLTMHGTTVPPQNQADSYKRMVDGTYIFGADKAWLLAPTRHGAHNWEGPGALTALTARNSLATLTEEKPWITQKASDYFTIFAGHSMGGHGAWHLATHHPDEALALLSLAGWNRKEEYGDSNIFFRHDIAASHVDPAVKAVMEACTAENEADRHAANLKGMAVLSRIGAKDRTIHPFFVRRMRRILSENKVNVTYVELPGKEHWWWDTWEANDGGAVNDPQLRDFTNAFSVIPQPELAGSCKAENGECTQDITGAGARYKDKDAANQKSSFVYVTSNPAFGGTVRGLKVLQQQVPFRTSKIEVSIIGDQASLLISNVVRFQMNEPRMRAPGWRSMSLTIDDMLVLDNDSARQLWQSNSERGICFCKADKNQQITMKTVDTWIVCEDCDVFELNGGRGPSNLGPARRVAESNFLIVSGSHGSEAVSQQLLEFSTYIANLFFLTSDTYAPVVLDRELDYETSLQYNLIVVGNMGDNSFTSNFLVNLPLTVSPAGLNLGMCKFANPQTGALFLAPHNHNKLALILLGNSMEGLRDVVSLATPTIPPMTRSPFSNMVPDLVITGPDFRAHGPAGYLCAGFWGNHWDLRPELVSCAHCV